MNTVLIIFHIMISLALIGLILLQNSKGGLGAAFGGGEFYRTKRGAEKLVFNATMIVAAVFLITSVLTVMVH